MFKKESSASYVVQQTYHPFYNRSSNLLQFSFLMYLYHLQWLECSRGYLFYFIKGTLNLMHYFHTINIARFHSFFMLICLIHLIGFGIEIFFIDLSHVKIYKNSFLLNTLPCEDKCLYESHFKFSVYFHFVPLLK